MKEFKLDFYDKTSLKSYNLDESMRYQLAMLGSLDVFTRKHSENVASITCRMCEYLHMKDYFTVYCTLCAYLHDIGKQFIPPAILQKNGPLTDEEFQIMKTHTTIGHEMCMKDEKLRQYADGPWCHHEGLDGSGYPRHLTNDEIPLEAKIIRVADEFDAITSKRQYKSHVGVTETLNILISETKPSNKKSDALNTLVEEAKPKKEHKYGKVDPRFVKALIKVIIDDTEYELYNVGLYVDYLKDEIKRLEQIGNYRTKMEKAHNENDRVYYFNGIKELLAQGETLENYDQVLEDYKAAYVTRKEGMDKLSEELKTIKRLKV